MVIQRCMAASEGRIARLFGIGEGWERPLHRWRVVNRDVLVALGFALLGVLSLEITRSVGSLQTLDLAQSWQYVWIIAPAVSLVTRRVWPLHALLFACVHLALTAWVFPEITGAVAVQFYYFFVLFSAIAWSRHRRATLWLTVLFAAVTASWVVAELMVRDSLDAYGALPHYGPFSPAWGATLSVLLTTVTFFCTAVGAGSVTWWSARREASSREQALTILEQTEKLSDQAVGTERLRIARELHDVVGHHVAVIGIQTAAARRTFEVSPEQATTAMLQTEESARSATRDLRLILTALRAHEDADGPAGPQPGLSGIKETLSSFETLGLEIDMDCTGSPDDVPTSVGVAVHRIVQESLTNVHRHSTADHVEVRLDIVDTGPDSGTVDILVRDNGRPKGDTSGSEVGLLGMRERALLHNGTLRASTADGGGFEVAASLEWTNS